MTESSLSVKDLYDLAGVSRPGYYRWVNASHTRSYREKRDPEDFELIKHAYDFRG